MSIDTIIRKQVLNAKDTKAESIIYARQMKKDFPNLQDYGYGKAGHTLDNWKDMKEAFELYGPKSVAKLSHKMISQTYRKIVGAIVDEIVAKSLIDNSYLGHYCWGGTVDQFVNTTKAQWLEDMIQQYNTVSPFDLKPSQKKAWASSYSALKAALKKNNKLKDTLLVFEYVLPAYIDNGVVNELFWPDALIVTDKKILVLEFKDRPLENDDVINNFLSQPNKYKRRLTKYHVESKDKQIKCILVSTQMQKTIKKIESDTFCSGDMLQKALEESWSKTILQFDHTAWLNSKFLGI